MPIYEYACESCGKEFETLVLGNSLASCPACGSEELERRLSIPTVHSDGTHAQAMRAARQRDKKQGRDRMHERIEYEASHDD